MSLDKESLIEAFDRWGANVAKVTFDVFLTANWALRPDPPISEWKNFAVLIGWEYCG